MYQLFRNDYTGNNKYYPIVDINRNRSIILREMSRIASYYKKRNDAVSTSHVIVQLLNFLNLSIKRDIDSTINACLDNIPYVCQRLGLIHPNNGRPKEFNSMFYNKAVSEYIIVDDISDPDLNLLKTKWNSVNTIRVLAHPFNDIDMKLPNGNYAGHQKGYAVLSIDILSLVLQYRYWCLNRLNNGNDKIRPEYFVYQTVIPNMIKSNFEICAVNRFMDDYDKKLSPMMRKVHPMSIVDITRNVDAIIAKQVDTYLSNKIDGNNFYQVCPSIFGDNFKQIIKPPPVIANKNVQWALVLACIKYVYFMIKYYESSDRNMITMNSRLILQTIRSLRNSNEYTRILTPLVGSQLKYIEDKLS